ncbi:hypothetical protein BGZ57DRAFT_211406 [Hyaloscypha finlandica]|nr:hypothetical protein BGZ57DRAFT_211406 [Hyaloscypha finlandica]
MIDKHEAAGTFDEPEYEEAYNVFTKPHISNPDLVPEPLLKSVIGWSKDKTVSDVRVGGSWDQFKNEGTLAGFSMIGNAKKINVRTLLINGNREIASNEGVRPFWREVEKVTWVTMNKSTHSPHLEEEEGCMGIISEFLIEEWTCVFIRLLLLLHTVLDGYKSSVPLPIPVQPPPPVLLA